MIDLRTDHPPKTGTFLADVGLPWLVVAVWNGACGKYHYADLQCGLYQGKWNDTYFETESFCEIFRWAPMPDMPPRESLTPITINPD